MSSPAGRVPAFHVVIPARYGSMRFPGKPLALVAGKAMVIRVVEQARRAGAASVTVATDDERIAQVVRAAAYPQVHAIMTRSDHASGSDRVLEAAQILKLPADALVINVQGDEPLLPPAAITQVAQLLADNPALGAATLSEPIAHRADLFNPHIVKVVSDHQQRALYFSRAPIPYARDAFSRNQGVDAPLPQPQAGAGLWQRHIGIYGYRLQTLLEFVRLPVAALETVESLEQLRLLANGIPLAVMPSCAVIPAGIDTPEDLVRVEAAILAGGFEPI